MGLKVKELIAELQKLDPEAEVSTRVYGYEKEVQEVYLDPYEDTKAIIDTLNWT